LLKFFFKKWKNIFNHNIFIVVIYNMNLEPGNIPIEENKVVVTLLNDNYLSNDIINLGVHSVDKTKITNVSIDSEDYFDIEKYTFIKDGFQTLTFEPETMDKIKLIYEASQQLSPTDSKESIPKTDSQFIQNSIDVLQDWVKNKYTELTGKTNIVVVCSRNMMFRVAGCDKESCQVSGNPLMHLDYLNFEATYKRQCLENYLQRTYPTIKTITCPPESQLIDIVNIWFPTVEVTDWPLGFLNMDNIEIKDYVSIRTGIETDAASIRYKDGLRAIYKKNMKPPELYFFRSATKDSSKKGVIHGSFRITSENFKRKSIELRCCIFETPTREQRHMATEPGNDELYPPSVSLGGKKRKTKKCNNKKFKKINSRTRKLKKIY
jgi:hypothetical protein